MTMALDAPTATDALISLRDVTLAYGDVVAAKDITFDVRPGEFVSLIGPSGCGKSSALRAIGGLLDANVGSVAVDGTTVTGPRPQEISYVFQDLALYPWRSALRNVEIALQFAGVPRRERKERAMDALRRVGLGDVTERMPSQLSGGMRQRVAIARALVSDARILLLDEPFAALDEQSRLSIGAQLVRILEEEGKTVVFVTHSLAEAAFLSDRVVVMGPRPGVIREVIDVPLERPRHASLMRDPVFHDLTDRLSALLIDDSQAHS
ncbi:ABC transporter ATP-binding protein [Demequina capsici]|uniref:ABC transporter ATP-binding protein n=1 Tax=Demequina capsici TaxID=3075620 RepID=A0AA96J7U5_9MICO|nr:ABC transporter ATP-binding protein [Demequina sp. OYTSA14]WNM25572.1 ABC transporter ATP-binding protein [Demequina sp. OYTSA14]